MANHTAIKRKENDYKEENPSRGICWNIASLGSATTTEIPINLKRQNYFRSI